ncbi:MAG: hypothetical protein WEB04_02010 [Dehalococcoidia bacterium]
MTWRSAGLLLVAALLNGGAVSVLLVGHFKHQPGPESVALATSVLFTFAASFLVFALADLFQSGEEAARRSLMRQFQTKLDSLGNRINSAVGTNRNSRRQAVSIGSVVGLHLHREKRSLASQGDEATEYRRYLREFEVNARLMSDTLSRASAKLTDWYDDALARVETAVKRLEERDSFAADANSEAPKPVDATANQAKEAEPDES